jgi:hypothetical protein
VRFDEVAKRSDLPVRTRAEMKVSEYVEDEVERDLRKLVWTSRMVT